MVFTKNKSVTGRKSDARGTSHILPIDAGRQEISGHKPRERIMLLQGPVGPFFKHLQDSLSASGYEVWRICFNAGDRFFSRKEGRISFYGDCKDWKNWLSDFITAANIDGIILFGSEREIHRIAREVAIQSKIKIISLEEGYIRPGFITIEHRGNNASSPIARCLPSGNSDVQLDDGKPVENFREGGVKVWHNIVYYSLRNLFTYGKQRKLYHKRFSLVTEIFCWARSVWRRVRGQTTNFMIIQHLLEHHDRGYFLIPLQVDSDCQLKEFSMGWSQVDLISKTLRSFAKEAPRGKRLVFKIHPLARGHSNYKHLIRETAKAYGVSDRVDVLDTGSLGLLTRHSAGMITINSTSGFSAIYHGIPLLVVGNALYAHPELATCGNGNPDFDSFWAGGAVANFETRRAYLGWVKHRALAVGDFHAARGIRLACRNVCSKLQEEVSAEKIEFKVRNAG